MAKESLIIADVALDTREPTTLTFGDLYTWVIWQFPRKMDGGLCGAVHPPTANEGWFPAIILNKEKRVSVHGHVDGAFATPEAAIEYLNHNGR